MAKIFISYSRKDSAIVDNIHNKLSASGFDIWLDRENMQGGDLWRRQIVDAISTCLAFVIVLSPNSIQSNNVRKELALAEGKGRRIIPVMIIKTGIPAEMEYQLAGVQIIDLSNNWETGLNRLIESLGKQKASAPSPIFSPSKISQSPQPKPAAEFREPATPKPQPRVQSSTAEILVLAPGLELTLLRIPAGEFSMGSDKSRAARAFKNEFPQHTLFLKEYFIAKYPITVAQFSIFAKITGLKTTAEREGHSLALKSGFWGGPDFVEGADWRHPFGPASDVHRKGNHPVEHITWKEAVYFCKWASEQVKGLGFIIRLPSEAEWEKAARGGLQIPLVQSNQITTMMPNPNPGRIYPWGDEPPDLNHCNSNSKAKDTTEVSRYSPLGDSPYGCADMVGNVYEWTSSLWGHNIDEPKFIYPYDPEDGRENPRGEEYGSNLRVQRGGSFYDELRCLRCAYRGKGHPNIPSFSDGFRVAASLF
jgi:formylglycine-generating enzyme required for sulfatase activity